jgi:hypothetical protein
MTARVWRSPAPGGFTVPQILDRLRQVGVEVEVEVDVKGGKP